MTPPPLLTSPKRTDDCGPAERAHSLFQAEGVKMEADSMSVRVADCACRRGAFEKARTAYEELAANAIRR